MIGKFNKLHKTISISLVASFLYPMVHSTSALLYADINNTKVSETCVLDSSRSFGYMGDASGKRVSTKEEFIYRCTKTTTEQGECNNWKEDQEKFSLNNIQPGKVVFETNDYSGSMGAALAIIQSYNKINGIWSGWHGLCQKGKDDNNWDWLSDPYVLASYAISAYAGSAGAEANAGAQSAQQSADYAARQGMQTASAQAEIAVAQQASAKLVNYSICAARAGLDTAHMIKEYNDDGEPCDPVDEMCDEEDSNSDSEIYTIPEKDVNDILNGDPDMQKYIKVLSGTGTGAVTVKIINPGIDTSANAGDMAAAKEALEKIKRIMLTIRALLMAIQLARCLSSAGSGGTNNATGSMAAELTSAQNLTTMAVSMYNPFVGIAMDAAFNTFDSMRDIDTCNDRDDAKEKGTRHIATLESKQHGMCHFVEAIESGSKPFSNKTKYRYCCYDDKLTRMLAEQSKAQLTKDWQHCTDMTLSELSYLKMKACTPEDRSYGIDGVQLSAYATRAQREQAYQYKRKCMDMEELVAYMQQTFGGQDMLLDDRTIKEQLDLLKVD